MHRSGTSAVTGVFVASGYHVGARSDLMEPDWGNPAGYSERLEVLNLNEQLMSELGANWVSPPEFASGLPDPAMVSRAQAAVDELRRGTGSRPVALKDPRIAVLIPIWAPVIDSMLHPVLVTRDPLEIAVSLTRRGGTPMPLALASWEIHLTSALDHLQGRKVTVAPYREMLESGEVTRSVIASATEQLDPVLRSAVQPDDGRASLRPDLYHHRALSGHGEYLTSRQRELWRYLSSLSTRTHVLDVPPELTQPSRAAREAARAEAERLELVESARQSNQRVSELDAQLQASDERFRRAEAERLLSEERLGRVLASRSWRGTAGMRALGRAARRLDPRATGRSSFKPDR
jgi:hypothetical protein